MATEYAAPFAGTTIATSQQFRDRNKMLGPDGIDALPTDTAGAVSDGGAGTSINVQNMTAIVQGSMYQLSGGPLNLAVAANGGGSNRFDIVALTYDASHSPGIYCRIIQGTPGAGLPAMTFNASGVWDHGIAHYEKTPAGAIVNLVDRRKFLTKHGTVLANFGPTTDHLYPAGSARKFQRFAYQNTGEVWEFDGAVWKFIEPGSQCPPVAGFTETDASTASTTFIAGTNVEATFVAPPSGKVYVTVSGASECTAPSAAQLSFEMRVTNSGGAIVLAADDANGVGQQEDKWSQASGRLLVTGLTPRVTYYARCMHRASGGTATFFRRGILVEPVLP